MPETRVLLTPEQAADHVASRLGLSTSSYYKRIYPAAKRFFRPRGAGESMPRANQEELDEFIRIIIEHDFETAEARIDEIVPEDE